MKIGDMVHVPRLDTEVEPGSNDPRAIGEIMAFIPFPVTAMNRVLVAFNNELISCWEDEVIPLPDE